MAFEYHLEIGKFEEFNDLTQRLNKLGEDRWEAVGFAGDAKGDRVTVLLKRVVISESLTWGPGSQRRQVGACRRRSAGRTNSPAGPARG